MIEKVDDSIFYVIVGLIVTGIMAHHAGFHDLSGLFCWTFKYILMLALSELSLSILLAYINIFLYGDDDR